MLGEILREQEPMGWAIRISLTKCQDSQGSGSLGLISPLRDHTLALPGQPTAKARASTRPWPWCVSSHHTNECNNDLDKQLLTAALCRALFCLALHGEEDFL